MTIYKPSFTFQSPRWRHGEWGNRNALGKLLLVPAVVGLVVVIGVAAIIGIIFLPYLGHSGIREQP